MKYCLAITTYNNFKSLDLLLNDLIHHKKKYDFIFIIDDCSPNANDELNQIINKYNNHFSKISFHTFDKNFGGATRSRNYCINYLKENEELIDFVTFLDQDDKVDNKFLEIIDPILTSNNKIDAINGKYIRNNLVKKNYINENNLLKKINFHDFKYHNFISMSGFTLKLKNNFLSRFSEEKKINAIEDYDFYLKFIKEGFNFYYLNQNLIEYSYYYSPRHLSSNKLKMLMKFSLVNGRNFGFLFLPFRILVWATINILKRIL